MPAPLLRRPALRHDAAGKVLWRPRPPATDTSQRPRRKPFCVAAKDFCPPHSERLFVPATSSPTRESRSARLRTRRADAAAPLLIPRAAPACQRNYFVSRGFRWNLLCCALPGCWPSKQPTRLRERRSLPSGNRSPRNRPRTFPRPPPVLPRSTSRHPAGRNRPKNLLWSGRTQSRHSLSHSNNFWISPRGKRLPAASRDS